MYEIIIHALEHTLEESLGLLPFLLITYIVMEYIEHKMSSHTNRMVGRSGKFGPLIGALAGVFPQCGFSAAAASFYAGRVITRGTLIAIFLSTSDEMLPIFISQKVSVNVILSILCMKVIIAIIAGFLLDFVIFVIRKEPAKEMDIHHLCEHDHCHCEKGIFKSAFVHTAQIFLFIFLISFALNVALHGDGEILLQNFILNHPLLASLFSGIVGLIPNCAASVVITQLYLDGAMSLGAMMSGLLVGAGVGLIVLFRTNDSLKDSLRLTGVLYVIGAAAGFLIDFAGITL